jgi:hypothetical protein
MPLYRNNIYQWEGDTTQPYPNNFIYHSGRILLPMKKTFYCARVIADTGDRQTYFEAVEARNRAIKRNNERISRGITWNPVIGYDIEINGNDLETVPVVADYSGSFRLLVKIYGDGNLLHTKEVYASDRPWIISQGIRARAWEIQIEGNVTVRRFDLADSVRELTEIQEGV